MLNGQGVIRHLLGLYASQDAVIGPLLRALPLNATTRQVLSLSRAEQTGYLEALWKHNQGGNSAPANVAGSDSVYEPRQLAGLFRRFNQLPCTVSTRVKRAALLSGLDPQTASVLLLGDDDLLSVELCRLGYQHVTVADCDQDLLATIRRETAKAPAPPRIIAADFRELPDLGIKADLVVLDPPYTLDGANSFLRLAVKLARPESTIVLMVNKEIMGPAYAGLTAQAKTLGLSLKAHHEGFNAYPIGSMSRLIMRLAWWHYMGVPLGATSKREIYFYSDCFLFTVS
ncbi:MAG: class I SAM-dependent methyltransferase [Deltaproteobacteria bacterium]|nr:class I SAM-dependent methyltransferase [Deltaproteobacteria bacterium]